jgi:hypothetical protein
MLSPERSFSTDEIAQNHSGLFAAHVFDVSDTGCVAVAFADTSDRPRELAAVGSINQGGTRDFGCPIQIDRGALAGSHECRSSKPTRLYARQISVCSL